MNHRLAKENNPEANIWADRVASCFKRDSLLMQYYNKQISDGKWNHMMDQVHIGYTSWNNPPKQVMPEVVRISPEKFPHTFAEKMDMFQWKQNTIPVLRMERKHSG